MNLDYSRSSFPTSPFGLCARVPLKAYFATKSAPKFIPGGILLYHYTIISSYRPQWRITRWTEKKHDNELVMPFIKIYSLLSNSQALFTFRICIDASPYDDPLLTAFRMSNPRKANVSSTYPLLNILN